MKIEAQWKNTILDIYEKQKLINFVSFLFLFLFQLELVWLGWAFRFVVFWFTGHKTIYTDRERERDGGWLCGVYIYIYIVIMPGRSNLRQQQQLQLQNQITFTVRRNENEIAAATQQQQLQPQQQQQFNPIQSNRVQCNPHSTHNVNTLEVRIRIRFILIEICFVYRSLR